MAYKKKPSVYTQALQQVQQNNQDEQVQLGEHINSREAERPNIQTSEQLDSKPVRQQRIKATFYLQPEDIIAIDEMQTKQFKQNGKKPEKSELVSEAIQLLSKQSNSQTVKQSND